MTEATEQTMKRIERVLEACRQTGLAHILETSAAASLEAGGLLRRGFGKPHEVRYKGDIDLVTEADLASERTIKTIIERSESRAAILAEESGAGCGEIPPGPVWIIDPLDGTTNFAHGYPWFGISIAYAHGDEVLVGVVYCPMQDELFCACRNCGAWLNGRPASTSEAQTLARSLVATGFPYDVHKAPRRVLEALEAVLTKAQGVRRAGAAALDLAHVACGRLDGFWEIKLKPWDTAAGKLLVEEAGGRVSDFQGALYSPFLKEIVATNTFIHEELVALLKGFGER
jgi:myo-inositol-1(or 4)-monophosphatase